MKLEYANVVADDNREITAYTNNYKLSDNTDTLGQEFTFDLVSNPLDANMANLQLAMGGKVIFSNDGSNNNRTSFNDSAVSQELRQIFTGIIVDGKKSGINKYSYTAFDYAFYLNKSETSIQYNDIDGTTAIRQVCDKNGVPLGSVPIINTKIKKVYEGTPVSDVIKDILKQATEETGYKYRIEVRGSQLFIEDYKDLVLDVAITGIVGDYNYTETIQDMKNRVLIISSSEKNEQVLANVEDADSIRQFGVLQKVQKVEDKEKAKAMQVAKKYLDDLNKIKQTFSVRLLGDDSVRSGRILKFNQPIIGMEGQFLIKNCVHDYGVNHTMSLELIKQE